MDGQIQSRYIATMPVTFDQLTQIYDAPFDQVIDVRSPSEYREDHIPGALSLPALSDAERAKIGTIYKQISPFQARVAGAAFTVP